LSWIAIEGIRKPVAALNLAVGPARQILVAVDALLFDDALDQLRPCACPPDSENAITWLKGASAIGKPPPPCQTPLLDRRRCARLAWVGVDGAWLHVDLSSASP
jgi:hypothetical protein